MTNTLDIPGIKEAGFEVSANYDNNAVRLSLRVQKSANGRGRSGDTKLNERVLYLRNY